VPIDEPEDPAEVYLSEADVAILTAIVGHPFRMPTLPELCWAAGAHGEELVKRRVNRLAEQGILEEVRFEDDAPSPKLPDRFYGTTEFGDEILERRLEPQRQRALQETYASLDKPDRIRRYERAPRPPR
jgi:hypothetical protein